MKTLKEIKKILTKHKKALQEGFKIKEIGIFGSYVRGEQRKRSDIDILVVFKEDGETFANYMELKFFLEEVLKMKVDLVLKDAIKERIKENILRTTIYV